MLALCTQEPVRKVALCHRAPLLYNDEIIAQHALEASLCGGGGVVIVDPLFLLIFFIAHASIHDLELSTAVLLAL